MRSSNKFPKHKTQVARKIANHRRKRTALSPTDGHYRLLFEMNPNPMYVFDERTLGFLAVNKAMVRNYGWSRAELLGMTADAIRPSKDIPRFRAALRGQRGSQLAYGGQWQHRRKDGSLFDVEVDVSAVEFAGRPAQLVLVTDITESKRAEEALRESEERHRAFFEQSAGSIVVFDPKTLAILEFNDEAFRSTGYTRAEFARLKLSDLEAVESPAEIRRHVAKLSTDAAQVFETKHRTKGGSVLDVEVRARLIRYGGKLLPQGVWHDVTRRKQAEEALRSSENRYRQLFEDNLTGNFLATPAGNILLCNTAFLKIYGFSSHKRAERGNLSRFNPTEWPRVVQQVVAHGKLEGHEAWHTTANGKQIHIIENLVGAFDVQGELIQIKGYVLDDTQRKEAEGQLNRLNATLEQRVQERTAQMETANAKLRTSEARLRQTAAAGNVGLWDWEFSTNQVFFSPEWKRQIGYEEHEISNRFDEWQSRVHPDDLEAALKKVHECIENPGFTYVVEFRFRHKDGSYRWILAQGMVLTSQDGKPQRMRGCHVDITQRKQAEEKILDLARFPEESPNPVFRMSKNGEMLYANPEAKPLMREFTDDKGRLSNEWRRIMSAALSQSAKLEIERQIHQRTFSFLVVPITQQGYVNIYGRDVTELKSLQQQLVEVSDQEQARIGRDLHEGLSQLLVSAAFDLARVRKRIGARAPEDSALFQQATESVDKAISVVRGVTRGLFAVQLGGEGVAQALHELAKTVTERYQIACRVDCPRRVAVPNDTAAIHLFRIAQEAVNNAIKHARARQIMVRLAVETGRIVLTVTDDGIGFTPAPRSGSGMGLHIMNYRARALGGSFKIERDRTKGTRVSCSVPTCNSKESSHG